MNNTTPVKSIDSDTENGATASERYLSRLARKTFLNFWSYSNPYTDENRGSELCDFIVIFGNDIIIFSDKHCEFPKINDVKTAWYRWYRRAIKKSVNQLSGAASFIKKFPNRIFVDSECKIPLPIPIQECNDLKIHLIAVTRGSAEASAKHWGSGSSSSLVINTEIEEDNHKNYPFMIGWPLKNRQFVHVLDELTLDILLKELDTTSDFINYLNKKEKFLTTCNAKFFIYGEEELLALYLSRPLEDLTGFSFPPVPSSNDILTIKEGSWNELTKSTVYSQWKKHNEISYEWDEFIEKQSRHIKEKESSILANNHTLLKDIQVHELVLRAMADEGRFARQILASQYNSLLNKKDTGDRLVNIIIFPNRPNRAYILLIMNKNSKMNDDEYIEARRTSLAGYCRACRFRFKGINEVIGIASGPLSYKDGYQDFILINFEGELNKNEKEKEISILRKIGTWEDEWDCV